jgi:hypothetical protein
MIQSSTRRGFLARALAAGAAGLAAALPASGAFAARKKQAVYVLDPRPGGTRPDGCGSCASCNACIKHGANKLFASEAAADANRAHPNCNCEIRPAGELPTAVFTALFGHPHPKGGPTQTGAVDRRHQRVAILLGAFDADLS